MESTVRGFDPADWLRSYTAVARRGQTWRNLLYVFLTFPLGLFYLTIVASGLSVGLGTAILGFGIIILLLTILVWWGCALLERQLVMGMLRVQIPPMSPPEPPGLTLFGRVKRLLTLPATWKSLAYLMAEFAFGTFAFVALTSLFALALALVLTPLAYIAGTISYNVVGSPNLQLWPAYPVDGRVHAEPMAVYLLIAAGGLLVAAGALHVSNGLAWAWGRFARVMLGMSESERRVTEARAEAAVERGRAETAEQSRRQLIVNASHELRTPVASIRGHVESLLMPSRKRRLDDETKKYLGIVALETERLSALVDDLLALARADAGELHLELRPVAVGQIVEKVQQVLAPLAKRERNVRLERRLDPALPAALADGDRLAQVLMNLVRNAITHTPEGGIVYLEAASAGDLVEVSVADTGEGIAPEDLERIFERFYRTDESRARASGGFGLGLSIARDLVGGMGGTITAESNPGEGSRFRVRLRQAPPTSVAPGS